METLVHSVILNTVDKIYQTQLGNIEKAARLMADSFEKGKILQAFGGGHSAAGAMELCARAGGFAPTKRLMEFSNGEYEDVEGVGTVYMKGVDIQSDDIFVLISNSGRNPLPIEMAIEAKKKGAIIIVITSMETTKKVKSRHSGGKNLYEYADVVIDNCTVEGDCSVQLEGMDTKICAMSSIAVTTVVQEMVCQCAQMMIKDGFVPPISKSKNIDGGKEYNQKLYDEYWYRVYHK